jgi:hypothetical protein
MKNDNALTQIMMIVAILCVMLFSRSAFGQTETLDGVTYTPPKGWSKTVKEGAVVYTDIDKAANTFCVMTLYGLAAGSGDPKNDFASAWKEFVFRPLAAEANPKTESLPAVDGWTTAAGGSLIEMNGVRSVAILTVFSGYGKTASVLAIFNDESYSSQMAHFVEGLKLDKAFATATPSRSPVTGVTSPTSAIEHWTILREYQDNQVGADAKYGGKRVTIVGPMDMVLIENGKPVIRMAVPAWSGRQMFCIFPVSQKSAVATLKADQQVVLECTVLGIAGGVSKVGRVDLGSSVGRLTLDNCILR